MKFLLLLISFTYILFAVEVNHTNVNITDFQLKYLEDTNNQYNIGTILNQKFTKTTVNKRSFGLSKGKVLWVKTDIYVTSDIKKLYIQHIDTVSVTNIELYFLKDKKLLKKVQSGIQNKETNSYDALLKVDVKKGETYTFLAKYSTKNSIIVHINIFNEQNYYNSKKNMHIMFAIFIGAIFALLIYNSYLYFALRHIQYVYFFGMVFSLSIFTMTQAGIFIEFFPYTVSLPLNHTSSNGIIHL
ncbi:MAG: hypothetical protein GQ570_06980 [Helicobacteraceae bacterium]|nr:hypothetical protein [Helicobacteraceae bacterium]